MRTRSWIAVLAGAALAVALGGCAAEPGGATEHSSEQSETPIGGDVIPPVTVLANELEGATVDLVVGQVLNIDTESLAVDSYSGEVSDPSLAEFTPGGSDGGAEFNPGVKALRPGSVEVTLTNEQGGIQPLVFTVEIAERAAS